jgi:hypothetical protein
MGLGLAICRMIIEHHGGQLTASSDGKNGSLFQFALPNRVVAAWSRKVRNKSKLDRIGNLHEDDRHRARFPIHCRQNQVRTSWNRWLRAIEGFADDPLGFERKPQGFSTSRGHQKRVMFAAGGFGYLRRLALYSSTIFSVGPMTHSYCAPMLCSSRGSDSMLKTLG